MKNTHLTGILLAVLAAIVNATVGIFSVKLFESGMQSESVAFYKSLVAFILLLSVTSLFKREELSSLLSRKFWALAICAFFGFFCLYFFETAAYSTVNVAVVIFMLFGSATITTFILNALFENRFLLPKEALSGALAVIGLLFIFDLNRLQSNTLGLCYAIIAGMGYGCFLTLSKRFAIGSGIVTLTVLLAFGCIYLFIPFAYQGLEPLKVTNLPAIILLALLPTVGGFYCTLKALSLIKSQSVQLIELTEPVFALVFSFIFLGQLSTTTQLVGGAIIILSIILHEVDYKIILRKYYSMQ